MNSIILYSIIFFFLALGTGMQTIYFSIEKDFTDPTNVYSPVAFFTRHRWLGLIPDHIYQRLPSSFAGDAELGFTSEDFDLSGNIEDGDERAGLDDAAKREIRRIMKRRKVNFDEARRMYTEQRFAKNDIGPDGRPRDPKFVSFS
jgi:hypothetical protein